ncbi:MAG: hypothetical protein LQ343_001337 [Gyalolechia ehrenbergii]|nr:MAG: hypothetical protein LQ343_001337 [Gyalolechia ehrenbergii]
MVYLAYGALLASLPILLYACKCRGWRLKLQSPQSRDVNSPPKASTGKTDGSDPKDVFEHSGVTLRLPDVKPDVQTGDEKDASNGISEGRMPEKANTPLGSATNVPASNSGRDQINANRAETEQRTRNMQELGTKMQPPARSGPRLKPKADNRMQPPSLPQRSNNSLRVPPTTSSILRPLPSAASTLRTPPTRPLAPPTLSAAPTASTLPSSKRPSKKVLLEPGHSPLDWAHLISNPPSSSYLRGDDVPPNLIRVPPSALRYHNGRKGKNAWGVWQGKVYNLTPYMKFHPGGVNELMKGAGREKDAERLFLEVHPWVNWEGLLGECLIGILVGEEETGAARLDGSGLEDMD